MVDLRHGVRERAFGGGRGACHARERSRRGGAVQQARLRADARHVPQGGCLGAVHARTERGEKRVQSFFDDPAVTVLPFNQDRVLEVEPRGGCFINANTPDELARIEQSYLGE